MLSPPVQFLKRVLPTQGWVCGFCLKEKKHVWAETPEELFCLLETLDSKGQTVYHACASFKDPDTRTRNNVHAVKSLWLDVDVGESKPYPDILSALGALKNFLATTSLPGPLFVNSGYGLHLYWPLEAELPLEEWEKYAQGLKNLCSAHSFFADPSRTADSASILRPVGTHNRKNPAHPKMVEWGGDVTPYPLTAFGALLTVGQPPRHRSSRTAAIAQIHETIPSNPQQIADQCAQLRYFREQKGVMPEPEWKACLGVLAFCTDGVSVAHEWSKGDARYSSSETSQKLNASKALTGPVTCGHFSTLNTRCSSCPFKGNVISPIELGRGPPRLSAPQLKFAEAFSKTETELPIIGAFRHQNGALVFKTEKDGKESFIRITQYPVVVDNVSRGEMNEESYSVVLRHNHPHEGWKSTVVLLKTLFGSSGIAEVIGRGIVVHNGDLFRQYVRESLDQINSMRKSQVQFEQFGWKDEETSFLIGNRLYTAKEVLEAPGGQEVRRRSKGIGPQPRGSLSAWKENVNMLFASGFEAQGFAVLTSFSAPLMRWQAHSEGGAIFSLVSRQGGKGKSTALGAAASVWGRLSAMKQTNADTRVARGIVLGVMGNLPVIRDEYTQRDPEVLREEIQIFTEGRDKQRGSSDGSLINLGASWQTIMIAGSNTSLIDTLRAAKNGEAMSGRVMEFSVDIPKDMAHWKGDQLKDNLDDNAGYAGEVFIQAILQPDNLHYLKQLLPQIREDIIKRHGLTSDKRFLARLLAGVAVAGSVVRRLNLIDMSIDRIMEWAQDSLFSEDAMHRGKPEEPRFMLARFLADHIQNVLVVPDAFRPKVMHPPLRFPTQKLLIRREVVSGHMFIETKALRAWMQKEEQPWKDLMHDLKEIGILISPYRLCTLGAGTEISTGQVPCVQLNSNHPILTGMLVEIEQERKAG